MCGDVVVLVCVKRVLNMRFDGVMVVLFVCLCVYYCLYIYRLCGWLCLLVVCVCVFVWCCVCLLCVCVWC